MMKCKSLEILLSALKQTWNLYLLILIDKITHPTNRIPWGIVKLFISFHEAIKGFLKFYFFDELMQSGIFARNVKKIH